MRPLHADAPPLSTYVNNSDGNEGGCCAADSASEFSSYHWKAKTALEHSIQQFIAQYGLNNCVVLTLTFPTPVYDHREASRRLNNAKRRLLKSWFGEMITLRERHKKGGWHFHLLCQARFDARSQFDIDAYNDAKKRDNDVLLHTAQPLETESNLHISDGQYRGFRLSEGEHQQAASLMSYVRNNCSLEMREMLETFQQRLPALGFGRFELTPILSTCSDAVACYFSKQYRQAVEGRHPRDKGVRYVSYTKGARFANTRFAWVEGGLTWRKGVSNLASGLCEVGYTADSLDDLKELLGSRWAYYLRDLVIALGEFGRIRSKNSWQPVCRLLNQTWLTESSGLQYRDWVMLFKDHLNRRNLLCGD